MKRGANVCPRCGASVTPYAAGCGVCGADLDRLRRPRSTRLPGTPSRHSLPYRTGDLLEGTLLTVLMVTVALFAPLYGMALAAAVGIDRRRRGRRTMRNMAIVSFALALLAFFVPVLPSGQLGPVSS